MEDFVICPYCNKEMRTISNSHLKKEHNKTTKEAKLEFPNLEFISQSSKNKREKTCINKFGCVNPMQNQKIREKGENTNLKRYGSKNPFASEQIKDKIKNTNKSKYGVKYTAQSETIKEKIKQTNIEKYGNVCSLHGEEIKKKVEETNLQRYGVPHPAKNKDIARKFSKSRKENNIMPLINKILLERDIEFLDTEYIDAFYHHNWKCCKCGEKFNTLWQYIQRGYQCPICYPRQNGDSIEEKKLREFLLSLGVSIKQNDRKLISPFELDIIVPELKIAFEYDGIYWHSEKILKNPDTYHLHKLEACADSGYRLITIFEDEWIEKKDIVKNRIIQILGKSNRKKINGRDCKIKEISAKEKNIFLNNFHLQGADSSYIKLGAFYGDILIAVMTFSHGSISKGARYKEGMWELNRFCSDYNYHIPGIAGKLLSYFKKNYEWKEIFSYADRRWSTGNLYEILGFSIIGYTLPNYWYVKNGKRIHRFNLRKNKNDPKNITEAVLRAAEGYYRIYDCGNIKFKLYNKEK